MGKNDTCCAAADLEPGELEFQSAFKGLTFRSAELKSILEEFFIQEYWKIYLNLEAYIRKEQNSSPEISVSIEETGGKYMSELNHEERKRSDYRYKQRKNGYHTVVKGCTDNLDSDELDLYRFMIGGVQGK